MHIKKFDISFLMIYNINGDFMAKKNGRNTKSKIVSAAWKLFYDNGYENTTIEDIIFESGTSKGSFYHYFESKDDKNHFYIFVYYSNFENVKENPELYVVPAAEVSAIVKEREKNVNNVSLKVLREKYSRDFIETIKIFK